MASSQYSTGDCTVTNASQVVIGNNTDWLVEIAIPAIFKVSLDGESTYQVGSVVSATRIILAANYSASTNSGIGYTIGRSFTSGRGYWRVLQGDADFAEILSQETIDPIDEDISHIMSGNATVDGTIDTSFGIDTDGNCLRIKSTNLSASRQYHFPNYNASIPSKNASQDWAETQRFNILTASILKTNDPVDENGVGDRGYYSDLVTENGIEEIWYSSTGDIVETTKTQTLANKRLTSPKINEDVALAGTATQLDSAISLKHAESHNAASHSDITSTGANIEDAVTKKHTQNTDTHLGTVDQDISLNTHKITGISVPDNIGQSVRTTAKITESNLESAVDLKHSNATDHAQNTDTGTTSTSFKINSGGSEADIKTTKLSGDRDFEFPDIDGLISISKITANNSFECIAYT